MDCINLVNSSYVCRASDSYSGKSRKKEKEEQSPSCNDTVKIDENSSCDSSYSLPSTTKTSESNDVKSSIKDQKNEKDLTVLFYMDGQYVDLERKLCVTMHGLESVGSDKNTNIVALLGRAKVGMAIDGRWEGIRQYYIEKNLESPWAAEHKAMVEEEKCERGATAGEEQAVGQNTEPDNKYVSNYKDIKGSMQEYPTLQEFIADGMSSYPAKNYAIVIMSHGKSWEGAAKILPKWIDKALEKGTAKANEKTGRNDHINVAVFNSCYMGNLESLNEIKNHADVTLASENYAYAETFYDWPEILTKIQNDENSGKKFDPKEFGKDFVEMYRMKGKDTGYITLAAIDNKNLGKLTETWGKFVKDWKESGVPDDVIYKDIKNSKSYEAPEYMIDKFDYKALKDIGSLAENVLKDPKAPEILKEDCKNIEKVLKDTIINEEHEGQGMEGSHGISIWAPTNGGEMGDSLSTYKYDVPSFEATGWPGKLAEDGKKLSKEKISLYNSAKFQFNRTSAKIKLPEYIDEANGETMEGLEKQREALKNKLEVLRNDIDLSDSKNYVNKA